MGQDDLIHFDGFFVRVKVGKIGTGELTNTLPLTASAIADERYRQVSQFQFAPSIGTSLNAFSTTWRKGI